jgi:hypothetical protein
MTTIVSKGFETAAVTTVWERGPFLLQNLLYLATPGFTVPDASTSNMFVYAYGHNRQQSKHVLAEGSEGTNSHART